MDEPIVTINGKIVPVVTRTVKNLRTADPSESHVRFTKEIPMQIDGQDYMFYEGFCEHSDYENGFLPTENVLGGSNVIETDTGDWRFFVESKSDWEVRLCISPEEE